MSYKFPLWKEAAERVRQGMIEDSEFIIYDKDLAELFDADMESNKYRYQLLEFQKYLLRDGVSLIRITGLGYKVATDSEKVNIVVPQKHRKIRNTLYTMRLLLQSVDPSKLTDEEKDQWGRWLTKSAMLEAYDNQLPLQCVPPSFPISNDNPKLVVLK